MKKITDKIDKNTKSKSLTSRNSYKNKSNKKSNRGNKNHKWCWADRLDLLLPLRCFIRFFVFYFCLILLIIIDYFFEERLRFLYSTFIFEFFSFIVVYFIRFRLPAHIILWSCQSRIINLLYLSIFYWGLSKNCSPSSVAFFWFFILSISSTSAVPWISS